MTTERDASMKFDVVPEMTGPVSSYEVASKEKKTGTTTTIRARTTKSSRADIPYKVRYYPSDLEEEVYTQDIPQSIEASEKPGASGTEPPVMRGIYDRGTRFKNKEKIAAHAAERKFLNDDAAKDEGDAGGDNIVLLS